MNKSVLILGMLGFALLSCSQNESKPTAASGDVAEATLHGQDGIVDEVSNPNIVQLAVKNPDLSTLVTAVQTANLATSLSNAGPFTVFAPLNAAFDKLPAGTVDGLLKPDKAD